MPRNTTHTQKPSTSKAAMKKPLVQSSDEGSDSDSDYQNQSTTIEQFSNIPELITNYVKYIINHSCTKLPIKRTDIAKALNIPLKDYSEVHDEAEAVLSEIYGLDLVTVAESKSGKCFIVSSALQNATLHAVSEEQRREGLILFIILAYIFMKGGEIQESELILINHTSLT